MHNIFELQEMPLEQLQALAKELGITAKAIKNAKTNKDLALLVLDAEAVIGAKTAPQQEKALETLGFELPDPDKPLSRRNNRKITFDAACRKMLFEIAKRHGLDLEEEAEYGNRQYLEKQDFILAKQKEQLADQQTKLDELLSLIQL